MNTPKVHDPLFDLDPSALRCPHETFHRIRAEAPVAWSDRLQCFLVTRYDDIVAVQRDHGLVERDLEWPVVGHAIGATDSG